LAAEVRAFVRNDSSITEATTFFTRVLEQDRESPDQRGAFHFSKRMAWQLGTAVLLIAWCLSTWEVVRQYREAGELVPPGPPAVAAAPAIIKTPRQMMSLAPPVSHAVVKKPVEKPVETAKMRVEILHHFPSGNASVWLDHQL